MRNHETSIPRRSDAPAALRGRVTPLLLAAAIVSAAALPAGAQDRGPATREARRVFVPYQDLADVIDPAARAVLMERKAFETLLPGIIQSESLTQQAQ